MKNIGLLFGIIMLVVAAGCREKNTVLSNPGVSLPEEPEMPVFAAATIALNDEAVELLGSNSERAMTLLDQAIAQQPDYHLAYANKGTLLIEKKILAQPKAYGRKSNRRTKAIPGQYWV